MRFSPGCNCCGCPAPCGGCDVSQIPDFLCCIATDMPCLGNASNIMSPVAGVRSPPICYDFYGGIDNFFVDFEVCGLYGCTDCVALGTFGNTLSLFCSTILGWYILVGPGLTYTAPATSVQCNPFKLVFENVQNLFTCYTYDGNGNEIPNNQPCTLTFTDYATTQIVGPTGTTPTSCANCPGVLTTCCPDNVIPQILFFTIANVGVIPGCQCLSGSYEVIWNPSNLSWDNITGSLTDCPSDPCDNSLVQGVVSCSGGLFSISIKFGGVLIFSASVAPRKCGSALEVDFGTAAVGPPNCCTGVIQVTLSL